MASRQAGHTESAPGDDATFDPQDDARLRTLLSLAVRQLARSAGQRGYAPLPPGQSAQYEDLVSEMQLAAIAARTSEAVSDKTPWQRALDAAVNAGRRFLYRADREVAASELESAILDDDEQGAGGQSDFERAQAQPWGSDGGESAADLERTWAPEERPALPPEWSLLRTWSAEGRLSPVDRQIVANWGMDSDRLASLTGLSASNARQRKHRLLEQVRVHLADVRARFG
jgi:hypothetical protein